VNTHLIDFNLKFILFVILILFFSRCLFLFSIGRNIRHLIDRPDGAYCFRLQKDRVYYCSELLMKAAVNITKDNLVSMGTCFGKFTKTKKFRLHITCLDYIAQYAKVITTKIKKTKKI
jgi:ribosome biogenesis protein Nip4